MKKYNNPNNSYSGFSLIEIILAIAIFMVLAVTGITTILHSFSVNKLGEEQTNADLYAQEGLEAVRSIKNQNWTNLSADVSTKGLQSSSGFWEFNETEDVKDKYTRQILISSVNRDVNGEITQSGGTLDIDTLKVTSSVAWNFSGPRNDTISYSTYLTNFRKPIVSGGPVMMAYSKTTSTPYYRTWDGSSWSAEGSANTVGGNINYIVLKVARTRDEAILGTLAANGDIYAQVWNGTNWGTPTLMATGLAGYRGFDIEYEESSDRAIIAYIPNATSADFAYRVWDGSSWSTAITVTTPPTTGIVRWIEMAQNPVSSSNQIAFIMIDANIDVYGMVWDGSNWGNMGSENVWDSSAATANQKAIDVAYETTSGRALFIWGDATSTDQYYRIWNGSSLTAATLLDIATMGGVANWVKLVSRIGSNEIMYGVIDAGSDLNTRKWSGTAWDAQAQHPEHDATVENATSKVFDLIWEKYSGNESRAWLLWGDGARVSKRQWSETAWGTISTLTGSDDTSFIRLYSGDAGEVFAGIYESLASATDDIWESRLTGGGTAWSSKNTIWSGAVSAEPVYFRIDIAGQ